jgi:hypothetical protein
VPNIEKRSIIPHASLIEVIALPSAGLSEEKGRYILTGDRTVDMARMALISFSRNVGRRCPKNVLLVVHIQRRAVFHDLSDEYGPTTLLYPGFARI